MKNVYSSEWSQISPDPDTHVHHLLSIWQAETLQAESLHTWGKEY